MRDSFMNIKQQESCDIFVTVPDGCLLLIAPMVRFGHGSTMDAASHPLTAFKILTASQWAQFEADGVFRGAPVDLADGYIHLSTAEQLDGTLAKHFAGQVDLVIAEVDLVCLGDQIRWEASRGGALFPHIYADLPLSAVIGHLTQIKA